MLTFLYEQGRENRSKTMMGAEKAVDAQKSTSGKYCGCCGWDSVFARGKAAMAGKPSIHRTRRIHILANPTRSVLILMFPTQGGQAYIKTQDIAAHQPRGSSMYQRCGLGCTAGGMDATAPAGFPIREDLNKGRFMRKVN